MLSLSTGPRPILDGKNFNRFFPSLSILENKNNVVLRSGTVEDAVAIMAKVAEKYKADTLLLANTLKADTLEKTCNNIWNFIYTYIQYQEDQEGIEQIRRPLRTWNDRQMGVDCDCMSVFISSILKNLGIDHYFRITKYDKPEYQHVYVIVPKNGAIGGLGSYYTVDGVIGAFDKEKKFSDYKDFNTMSGIPIQFLNGPGGSDDSQRVVDYLVETKNIIESNPIRVNQKICPCDAVPMFDMVIGSWNDPARRNFALQKTAEIESKHFPKLKFFQMLNNYMNGRATSAQVMKENYLNGLGSLNGDWGIGDNGDGTYYVFDWDSSETLWDNLTKSEAEYYLSMFNTNTGSGSGSGNGSGSGGNQGGGSGNKTGSGGGTNWWGGMSDIISSLLNTFKPGVNNGATVNPTPGSTSIPIPSTPKTTPWSTTNILITLGVVAAVGGVIWSLNSKKPESKKIEAKTSK